MIIDTSALIAILHREPEAPLYDRMISRARNPRMSVANYLEATIVSEGRSGSDKESELEELVKRLNITLVPVTLGQMRVAQQAWRDFGKGNDPAALNYGDCFAYALASVSAEPLLFKGSDFAQTDIPPAHPAP